MLKEAKKLLMNLEDSIDELDLNIEKLSMIQQREKSEKVKKKFTYTYDTQETSEVILSKKKFLKSAIEFFHENSGLKEDEIFYIVKSFIDKDNKIQSTGAYYGMDMSPFTFLLNSNECSEEMFLAEATSKEAILDFLCNSKKVDENIYAFKIEYKDFKLSKIKSIYGGPFEFDFYIFNQKEEDATSYGEVLKRFGEINYAPSIKLFKFE